MTPDFKAQDFHVPNSSLGQSKLITPYQAATFANERMKWFEFRCDKCKGQIGHIHPDMLYLLCVIVALCFAVWLLKLGIEGVL